MTAEVITTKDIGHFNDIQPQEWPDITPHFQYYIRSNYCIPLKIASGDIIKSMGAVIFHQDTAWLAHIITHPEFRNQGLGGQMTNALLLMAKTKGIKTVSLLATESGFHVYKRCGFEADSEYLHFAKPKEKLTFKLNKAIVPFHPKYLASLFNLDEMVSGEKRQMVLKEHLDDAAVFCSDQRPTGFYLPSLGNGLILAEDADAGVELMKIRLKTTDKVMFPEDNKSAMYFVEQYKFEPYQTARRMWWGKKFNWKPENIFNRIGGHLG